VTEVPAFGSVSDRSEEESRAVKALPDQVPVIVPDDLDESTTRTLAEHGGAGLAKASSRRRTTTWSK